MADETLQTFQPPRSNRAFGVASILSDNCRVFYDSLFTTRHLGRIADLLAARLQKAGPDELRFRALILFLAYEGFRCQFPLELQELNQEEEEERALASPLTVECGIDDEKIAVGVSFEPHSTQRLSLDGLAERIQSGAPANRIERALVQLLRFSGQVFYRYQPATGRIELIALTGIGQLAKVTDSQGALEIHEIPEDPEATPRAVQYAELGDEAYETLLKDEQKGRGANEDGADSEKRFGGDEDEEEGLNRLGKEKDGDKDQSRKVGSGKRKVGSSSVIGSEDDIEDDEDLDSNSSSSQETEKSQKVGGKEPVRKGRMKVGAQGEEEAVEAEEEGEARLGKDSGKKRLGSLGVKASDEAEAEASETDESEIRLGGGGPQARSRKIGVKNEAHASGDGDESAEDELRLGSGYGSGKKARSQEEQRADAKAIREFDDSDINPNQVTPEQIERYKEQIQRMSRRLTDLEEDRAKWMRMVKADGERAKTASVGSSSEDSDDAIQSDSDAKDELKLKRLQPKKSENSEVSEDTSSNDELDKGEDELRVKKLKDKNSDERKVASQEEDSEESDSEKTTKEKKNPGGFLRRLFGGGQEDSKKESTTRKDEDSEGSKKSSRDDRTMDEQESKKKKKGFFSSDEEAKTKEEQSKELEEKSESARSEGVEDQEEELKVKSDDPAEKADELVKEMESGTFHEKMAKSKEELDAIRERIKDEKVKAWADGMMADIMKEKARLAEMARSLNQSVRAKEAEFNRKSQYFKQEVLNREEQIRKGQLATARVREQLSLSNSASERLKIQISNLETQEAAGRQKVQASERLVQVAKEEALAAQRLAENLKSQLLQAGSATKKVELVQKELIASKAQTEKAIKQVEDMKRLNTQLTEKLTAASQSATGAGGTEDLKRKLEAAGRLTAVHKKEAETFKAKMESSIKEEARLRSEVTKLQAEVKRMKALSEMNASATARKPGGSGGKAA